MRKGKTKVFNSKQSFWTYFGFMVWPTIFALIFYFGVNFNSLLFAFQKFNADGTFSFDSELTGFKQAFAFFTDEGGFKMVGMAFFAFFLNLVINVPLGLFFSYYIAKKRKLSGLFRIVLFIPSILSSIVTATIFRFFVQNALPEIVTFFGGTFTDPFSSKASSTYAFITLMIYNIFIGFGSSVLMYSNVMSGVSPDVLDAAKIDGLTGFREFIHIHLPAVFPTFTVFFVSSTAAIFINQINIYSLFAKEMGVLTDNIISFQTIGFYLFYNAQLSNNQAFFPKLSAIGLILSAVAIPLTFGIRFLLNQIGPSEK